MIIEEDSPLATLPNGYDKTEPNGVDENTPHESHESLGEEPAVDPDSLPPAHNPTVAFLIPFPQALRPPSKKNKKVPPFMMYAPLAAPLPPKAEGEKEGITTKAARRWQKEEKEAREKGTGFKAKAVKLISKGMSATKNSRIEFLVRTPNKKKLKELRFVYPASWPADNVQQEFTEQVKSAKKGAIMNGVIATSLAPFALAFDTLTFIPGPFEITAVWSASSWTGAARASGIAKRITSSELPISFSPDPQLEFLRYRLHQLCWEVAKRGTVNTATWNDTQTIKRGPELASVVLEVVREFGEDMNDLEMNKSLIAKDLDRCMRKAAKEWAKAAT
ncbi:uncharacterized protein FIBRA_01589 [Fibroporia radiculosa]|uniref:Uncharacterized protein n=1 Tax=Fibroporia radiculosa TaxID=599839 RepID=J4I8K5_9APHY|nr:uncharacterized protein FIBRA_01589 [Fibroporia radiculosa]CCL99571.1 predicted protein [Fibroporia radiculosa]